MTPKSIITTSIVFAALMVIGMPAARADEKATRAAIADALDKLAKSTASLAETAKRSDDRGARKRFAPAAVDLGDDLAAAARRAGKDVPMSSIAKDAAALDKDAVALVEFADEAEDKDERKALRSQASLISQTVAQLRKLADTAAAAKPEAAKPAEAPPRFTGRLFNTSNACSWEENVKFIVSTNGQQVFTSGLVFPGKDATVVVYKGSYLVQVVDTVGKLLAQGNLAADREGWSFKSGCVNQD